MTHPLLRRDQIEATLIALAAVRPDIAAAASRRALDSDISADCLAVLDAITENPDLAWRHLHGCAESAVEAALIEKALNLTVFELTFHSVDCLLALARGRLPEAGDMQEAA